MVRVEGFDSADAIFERREVGELHVHPVMAGAGRPGVGQIIIGIIIIAAAYISGGASLTASGGLSATGSMYLAGAMMILGGVMQLLAPQPSINSSTAEKSRYLGNGRNTVAIGTRIPMIYGRRKAYGQYISFDTDAGLFDSAPAAWYSSPFTDNGELNYSAAPPDLPMGTPAQTYKQPTSLFTGISYPATLEEEFQTFINFNPITLTAGEYDLNFATGQTLHVSILSAGVVTQATLLGGETANLPIAGTSIAFTQNYG
jgi:hypothetical protein